MWHWIVYKWRRSNQMLSFRRTSFNLLDFTVSLSCRDWHSETPWSHSSNQPGGTYCQAQDFLLRTAIYTLEMWCASTKSANQSPPALWKHLSFQCLGVIVALNGKSASMLLEPTKNKLTQWRVIEKSVNKCNFFLRCFEIITKWMKITDRQICEDQIVTFKQIHILLYQGLVFFTRSTCVIVDARSHTCKSQDFIPRYDIIVQTNPGTARNQPVRGPGVWCDWSITLYVSHCRLVMPDGDIDLYQLWFHKLGPMVFTSEEFHRKCLMYVTLLWV